MNQRKAIRLSLDIMGFVIFVLALWGLQWTWGVATDMEAWRMFVAGILIAIIKGIPLRIRS